MVPLASATDGRSDQTIHNTRLRRRDYIICQFCLACTLHRKLFSRWHIHFKVKFMKSSSFVWLAAGLFSFSACSKAPETVNIQSLNQQFISAWNSKDEGKITGFLADDVQFIQGDSHLKGKSEVSQKWVRETLPSLNDLKTSVASSEVDEHTAYEAGTFSVDVLPAMPNDPHGYGEGNYILLWKKGADNTWKLSYAQLEDLPVQRKN